MEEIVLVAIQAVEGLLPILANATSGQVQGIILLLEKAIPAVESLGADLLTPITNIITTLQGNVNVTPEQITTLNTQLDAAEAQLDADAKADGLTGVGDDSTTAGASGSTGV